MKIADQILSLIQDTFVPSTGIALHEPRFDARDQEYVRDCIETGWVSTVGKYVDGFEKKLTEITGIPHAIAVVNGTCALHACLKLVGTEIGDEVLIPSLTFVATANAVHHCGAVPHFIASEEKTLGVDPEALEDYLASIAEIKSGKCVNKKTGRVIRALIPVHIYGTPCDMEALLRTCRKYHLELVEDAAESLGSSYRGKHTGAFGKLASVSFNGNKIVTTGGGGAILTTDATVAKQAKHLTNTAKQPHPYKFFHDVAAFNYRLPNLNAALGLSQLERFDALLAKKKQIHAAYKSRVTKNAGFSIHDAPRESTSNYWLNVAILNESFGTEADTIFEKTQTHSIHTRPAWELLHTLPMYKNCPRTDMAATENLAKRIVCLPSSPHLATQLKSQSKAA